MPPPTSAARTHWFSNVAKESVVIPEHYETVKNSSSKAFQFCKPVSQHHPHYDIIYNVTHQCIAPLLDKDGQPYDPPRTCYKVFFMQKNKTGRVSTSQLTSHMQQFHGDLWEKTQKVKESKDAIAGATIGPGPLMKHFSRISQRPDVKLSSEQRLRMKYKQALVIIYSRSKNPFTASKESVWRDMVMELVGPSEGKPPFLSTEMLKRFINQEYENMQILGRKVFGDIVAFHQGNKPLQVFHDGCTIEQTHFLGGGVQGIHPILGNMNFAFCCVETGHKSKEIAGVLRDVWQEMFMSNFVDVVGDVIQDYAALGVSRELGLGEHGCLMHSADKVPRIAVGIHPQSRNGVRYNEFSEGEALVQKSRDIASAVSKSSLKRKGLLFSAEMLGIHVSKLKVDKGNTRMNSILQMMRSVVKNEKSIIDWVNRESGRGGSAEKVKNLSANEWLALREVEGLLTIMGTVITLAQHEQAWTAAYRLILSQKLKKDLTAESIPVLSLADSKQRVNVKIQSDIAKEVLQRGVEESARRIGANLREFDETIGNKSTQTKLANRRLKSIERAAVLLDLRTKSDRSYMIDREELKEALLEVALEYQMNLEKHKNAASAENASGGARPGFESDSSDDDLFFVDTHDGRPDDEELDAQFRPAVNRLCRQWMDIKSSKPAFWKENFPLEINDGNIEGYTIATDKGERMDPIKLMNLDMHGLYVKLMKDPRYGFIPKLAMCILGRNLSESFVERLFSAASLILSHRSSLMDRGMVEKLTLLRMNMQFMKKVKASYPKLLVEMVEMESDEGKKRKAAALEDN